MPHNTKQIICHSLLEIFTPDSEYVGVRDHFTAKELEKLDEFYSREDNPNAHFSKKEIAFILYALTVVLYTGEQAHPD